MGPVNDSFCQGYAGKELVNAMLLLLRIIGVTAFVNVLMTGAAHSVYHLDTARTSQRERGTLGANKAALSLLEPFVTKMLYPVTRMMHTSFAVIL